MSPRLHVALDQLRRVREYTLRLIDTVPEAEWFCMPSEGVTHIAWQVGHLAMAEYRLALDRVRGPQPEDEQLITTGFLKLFARESVAEPDPAKNPSPAALRATLDRVHRQVLADLPLLADAELDQPSNKPHPMFTTKHGALIWLPQHEMVHAGQIGLLRRLLGQRPLW